MKPTAGDIRCMVFGHVARYAICRLRKSWNADVPAAARLERFSRVVTSLGDHQPLINRLAAAVAAAGKGNYHQMPLFPEDDRDAVSV